MDGFDFLGIWSCMQGLGEKVKNIFPKKTVIQEIKPKKYSYRPQLLENFIGQEQAKDLIRLNLKIILTTKPRHFLLSGIAGGGKTTLAGVIANHLSMKANYYTGSSFTAETLISFLRANELSERPMILFVDEIHAVKIEVLELMLPIIEDFKVNGTDIRPFILICATNLKTILMKKSKAFVDRLHVQLQLMDYLVEDIEKILRQYNDQVYKEEIPDDVYLSLAENTRFTPRIALSYMDLWIACRNINVVLKSNRIISHGLTDLDFKILRHLKDINKPVSAETLAIVTNQEKNDYLTQCEPYLLRQELIGRTNRGRVITSHGLEMIK